MRYIEGFEVRIPDDMTDFDFMQEIRKLAKKILDEMPKGVVVNNKRFYIHISDGTVETEQVELQLHESVTLNEVKKSIERLGRSVCAYCGNEEDQADGQAILNHILTCEKRPEKNMLEKAFEIENKLYARIIHLTDHPYDPETCDTCKEIREVVEIFQSSPDDEMPIPQEKLP